MSRARTWTVQRQDVDVDTLWPAARQRSFVLPTLLCPKNGWYCGRKLTVPWAILGEVSRRVEYLEHYHDDHGPQTVGWTASWMGCDGRRQQRFSFATMGREVRPAWASLHPYSASRRWGGKFARHGPAVIRIQLRDDGEEGSSGLGQPSSEFRFST